MTRDAFSQCHPAVCFVFFAGAIGTGMLIQHPAYLLAGAVGGAAYYLLLSGRRGWRMILGLLPVYAVLTAVNPLFNTDGATVLFYVFGRPYTAEALMYGAAIAAVFAVTMLWFGCYHAVMTGDKFTSLFGNLLPSICLLLVMVFRMVPNLIRKARQITGARSAIGMGTGASAGIRQKLRGGMTVLGALTSWALEGGVVTGDSMRARGYGTARRSSFRIYRMTTADRVLLVLMPVLLAAVIFFVCRGAAAAEFTPVLSVAPVSGINALGLAACCVYFLIPTLLHIREAVIWRISRSKI